MLVAAIRNGLIYSALIAMVFLLYLPIRGYRVMGKTHLALVQQ
jgi:hypothetical protein